MPGRVVLRRWLVAGGALLVVAAGALGVRLALQPPSRARIVVLISVDTLRPDHLGCYGYERRTSPALDALAREGVVFEDASSPAPWTLPAHASMLTGLYPRRHGLITHEQSLPLTVRTLALVLSDEGYSTAAVVNSYNLAPRFGLDRGFQKFRYVPERVDRIEPSSEIVDQAISWLREAGSGRFFLFLHTYDVHSDYRSQPVYEKQFLRPYVGTADGSTAQIIAARRGKVSLDARDAPHLIDLYDAGIRQMDDELGRFVRFLEGASLLDETLLIVTSDHGEEFFEHSGFLHGRTQYGEVSDVPLILHGPGIPPGARVKEPVTLLDVMPTVLALQGVSAPDHLDGVDISSLSQKALPPSMDRTLFGEADHGNSEPDITRSARHRNYKLHYDRLTKKRELYDLGADPGERIDLVSRQPEVSDQLLKEIVRFMEIKADGFVPTQKLTPEQIEKLESLGYVGN